MTDTIIVLIAHVMFVTVSAAMALVAGRCHGASYWRMRHCIRVKRQAEKMEVEIEDRPDWPLGPTRIGVTHIVALLVYSLVYLLLRLAVGLGEELNWNEAIPFGLGAIVVTGTARTAFDNGQQISWLQHYVEMSSIEMAAELPIYDDYFVEGRRPVKIRDYEKSALELKSKMAKIMTTGTMTHGAHEELKRMTETVETHRRVLEWISFHILAGRPVTENEVFAKKKLEVRTSAV